MTVPIATSRAEYTGNGVAATFSFSFEVQRATDLLVTRRDLTGGETTLAANVDYSASFAAGFGGSITLLAGPLANGYGLTIRRLVPYIQDTSFRNQGRFYARTHETLFDRIVMMIQSTVHDVSRMLRLGESDVNGAGAYRAQANRIQDLGNPVQGQDAVTRAYLESFVASIVAGGASVVPARWFGTGNGVTTAFAIAGATVSYPEAYLVTIDGVTQEPGDDYGINLATGNVVFTEPPPTGLKIDIRVWGFSRAITDLPAPPRFTTATRPTASSFYNGKRIRVKDPTTGETEQVCLELSNGTFEWVESASAPFVP